ncbi:R-spondin-3 [Sinocyclocheilus rhinocerous]|uniref:R-spondin Fu-CRD domain-containing protein n=1 Tax=Sinocyclocheilus rhinocerous TaxID=307959 RepID=A0A673GS71_9TELE|nr:PREDICTED: R-spondin-3 [Sinocyclocheilus rhinocerous]
MQLQLISIVLILHCMEYTNCQHHGSRHRLHKQGSGVSSQGCQGGCQTCSVYNGCLTCKPKLFIHFIHDGMRQIGVCLASCPNGFYGTRSPDRNDCIKCGSECDSCFNRNFCLRCRAGSYLHKGKCMESCPDGLMPSDTKKECVPACPADCDSCQNSDTCTRCAPGHFLLHGQCHHVCPDEFEPNDSMECIPTVHCEVGEWSEWGPCSRSGKTCGFKWGEETRTRKVLQNPSPMGSPCPATSETRECLVKRRRCKPKGQRRGEKKKRFNLQEKENAESRRERKREREKETINLEDSESRNKTEHRRRRDQSRDAGTV